MQTNALFRWTWIDVTIPYWKTQSWAVKVTQEFYENNVIVWAMQVTWDRQYTEWPTATFWIEPMLLESVTVTIPVNNANNDTTVRVFFSTDIWANATWFPIN